MEFEGKPTAMTIQPVSSANVHAAGQCPAKTTPQAKSAPQPAQTQPDSVQLSAQAKASLGEGQEGHHH